MFPQGERGAKGLQGEKGVKGQEGPSGVQVRHSRVRTCRGKRCAFVYCVMQYFFSPVYRVCVERQVRGGHPGSRALVVQEDRRYVLEIFL